MVDGIESDVVLLGISGFRVRAVVESEGELWVGVETTTEVMGCPDCGTKAKSKGRRKTMVRDLPAGGRPVRLVWRKRRWSCPDSDCDRGSWSETHPETRPRAVLTERARCWAFGQVGEKGRTVASVAADLGVGWHTVMDAVREFGEPLVEDLSLQGCRLWVWMSTGGITGPKAGRSVSVTLTPDGSSTSSKAAPAAESPGIWPTSQPSGEPECPQCRLTRGEGISGRCANCWVKPRSSSTIFTWCVWRIRW